VGKGNIVPLHGMRTRGEYKYSTNLS